MKAAVAVKPVGGERGEQAVGEHGADAGGEPGQEAAPEGELDAHDVDGADRGENRMPDPDALHHQPDMITRASRSVAREELEHGARVDNRSRQFAVPKSRPSRAPGCHGVMGRSPGRRRIGAEAAGGDVPQRLPDVRRGARALGLTGRTASVRRGRVRVPREKITSSARPSGPARRRPRSHQRVRHGPWPGRWR